MLESKRICCPVVPESLQNDSPHDLADLSMAEHDKSNWDRHLLYRSSSLIQDEVKQERVIFGEEATQTPFHRSISHQEEVDDLSPLQRSSFKIWSEVSYFQRKQCNSFNTYSTVMNIIKVNKNDGDKHF